MFGLLFGRWDGLTVALLDAEPADRRGCVVLKVIGRKFKDRVYPRVYLPAGCAWLNDHLKRCFERDGRKFPKSRSILLSYLVWYLAGRSVPLGYELHHKNGNHWDNRIENLEPLTKAEHLAHHRHFPRLPDELALAVTWVKSEDYPIFTQRIEFETRFWVTVMSPKGRKEKGRKRTHNSGNHWLSNQLREQGWRPARVENAIKVLVALAKAGATGVRSSQRVASDVGLTLPSLRAHLVALTGLGYASCSQGTYHLKPELVACFHADR